MKRQVRRGVFETNSSSTHSITMCSNKEYEKWENGEVLYWQDGDKFGTREEIIEELKKKKWYSITDWNDEDVVSDIFSDERVKTCDEFFDNDYYETYSTEYTTPNGEVVVAFGYYGYN